MAETIFDAGLRDATVQHFLATYDGIVANYRQAVLIAFQQVEDKLAALRILAQVIQQQEAAVQQEPRGSHRAIQSRNRSLAQRDQRPDRALG